VWFPGYGWVTFDPTPAGVGSTEALTSWLWPGRFLFDGLQHRWNKWILDYNLESQSGLFQRVAEFLRPRPQTEEVVAGQTSQNSTGRMWGILLVVALSLSAYVLWRRPADNSPETRLYLKLRESCRRAGLVAGTAVAPLSLVEQLAQLHHPAHGPARSFVTRYLRARFGGQSLEPSHHEEMRVALEAVRRALRKTPTAS